MDRQGRGRALRVRARGHLALSDRRSPTLWFLHAVEGRHEPLAAPVTELGDIAAALGEADPYLKLKLYRSLRLRLTYDDGSGGPANDFTNRNTTFMTWNLLHLARLLRDAGGVPAFGNQRRAWDAGARFDFPNPEYR